MKPRNRTWKHSTHKTKICSHSISKTKHQRNIEKLKINIFAFLCIYTCRTIHSHIIFIFRKRRFIFINSFHSICSLLARTYTLTYISLTFIVFVYIFINLFSVVSNQSDQQMEKDCSDVHAHHFHHGFEYNTMFFFLSIFPFVSFLFISKQTHTLFGFRMLLFLFLFCVCSIHLSSCTHRYCSGWISYYVNAFACIEIELYQKCQGNNWTISIWISFYSEWENVLITNKLLNTIPNEYH